MENEIKDWVLVPREPTEAMLCDGFESEPDECFSPAEVWQQFEAMSGCQQAAHRARLCYAAMLAAAPTPPAEAQVADGGEWPAGAPLYAAPQPASAPVGVERLSDVPMTADRATHFLRRFKGDEKMLGPHEQQALDFAITAMAQQPAAVDEAMERLRACPKLWYADLVGDRISQLRMRAIVTAALAQPQGEG